MRKIIFCLAITAVVAGCATTTVERAARVEREVEDMIKVYGPACEKLGYEGNSDRWRDCIIQLNTKDAYESYMRYPTSTTCFGQMGFYQCTGF